MPAIAPMSLEAFMTLSTNAKNLRRSDLTNHMSNNLDFYMKTIKRDYPSNSATFPYHVGRFTRTCCNMLSKCCHFQSSSV